MRNSESEATSDFDDSVKREGTNGLYCPYCIQQNSIFTELKIDKLTSSSNSCVEIVLLNLSLRDCIPYRSVNRTIFSTLGSENDDKY